MFRISHLLIRGQQPLLFRVRQGGQPTGGVEGHESDPFSVLLFKPGSIILLQGSNLLGSWPVRSTFSLLFLLQIDPVQYGFEVRPLLHRYSNPILGPAGIPLAGHILPEVYSHRSPILRLLHHDLGGLILPQPSNLSHDPPIPSILLFFFSMPSRKARHKPSYLLRHNFISRPVSGDYLHIKCSGVGHDVLPGALVDEANGGLAHA